MSRQAFQGNSLNVSQNALSTSAELILASNPLRASATIKNLDGAIYVYLGHSSAVSSSNGMELKNGESIEIKSSGAIYAIAASATPTIAILEELWAGR